MINWSKKKERDKITIDNIATSLRELTLHGKPTYEEWSGVLNDLKEEYFPGYPFSSMIYRDYDTMLSECLSLDHEWTF
jgi:hypothetical protein